MFDEALYGIGIIAAIFIPSLIGFSPAVKTYTSNKINDFFKEIKPYDGEVSREIFEEWISNYYKITEPERNLRMFAKWGVVIIAILFIDIFTDYVPDWLYGLKIVAYEVTFISIVFFSIPFFYLILWYVRKE